MCTNEELIGFVCKRKGTEVNNPLVHKVIIGVRTVPVFILFQSIRDPGSGVFGSFLRLLSKVL